MKIIFKIFLLLLSLCFFNCNKSTSYVDKANDVIKKYKKQGNDLEKTLEFFENKNWFPPRSLKNHLISVIIWF